MQVYYPSYYDIPIVMIIDGNRFIKNKGNIVGNTDKYIRLPGQTRNEKVRPACYSLWIYINVDSIYCIVGMQIAEDLSRRGCMSGLVLHSCTPRMVTSCGDPH